MLTMSIPKRDRDVLRRLAEEQARIAALPVHREKAELWRRLNDLESVRPMVWINEIPWHEMDVDGELTLQTEHPWARDQERDLRRTLYQWRHLPGDMIVRRLLSPARWPIHSTDFGIIEDVDVVTDRRGQRHRLAALPASRSATSPTWRRSRCRWSRTTRRPPSSATRRCASVYGDIMPVQKVGQTHIWFTPWDYLIRWWGIEEAMIDMIERPDLVHAGVERMVDAWMVELDQFVALNLLSLDCDNTRIGSGGYGYTQRAARRRLSIPTDVRAAQHVGLLQRPDLLRGLARDALGVRPEARSALAGALGPDLLRLLRAAGRQDRASCGGSPTCARSPSARGATPSGRSRRSARDYVISRKPNPAILAEDDWHPERARQDLRDFLDKAAAAATSS